MRHITVHQIWLNKEPPPPSALGFMATWDRFTHIVHGPDEIPTIGNQAAVRDIYRRYPNKRDAYRALSDLLRYQILLTHGGLYADIDMELCNPDWHLPDGPALFRPMNEPRKFRTQWDQIVCNGLMWFPEPGHDLMRRSLEEVNLDLHRVRPHILTGPVRLRRVWREYPEIKRIDHPEVAFQYNRIPGTCVVSRSQWWKHKFRGDR